MKRLYYLFKGTDAARSINHDLQAAGLGYGQLHFMTRNSTDLAAADLHTTTFFDEHDLQHKGMYGGALGLGAGLLFGFYVLALTPGGTLNLGLFFFICLIFTGFGAWAGGLIGASADNHHIARFHDDIESGSTLLMLDTYDPKEESQVKNLMHSRHLEARYEGEEDNFKVFF